jgi:hypothetical protein
MDIIIIAAIAFWLGARFRAVFDRILFREILKDLGISEQQLRNLARDKQALIDDPDNTPAAPAAAAPQDHIEIRVEQHQGQLYAFRLDNDRFLAQGSSPDDLIARIAESYKNTKFTVAKDQGADLMKNG